MPVIKRTPAGAIYTKDNSDRLLIYFRGRRVYTKLRHTRLGVQMAEDLLARMWREEEGLGGPSRPRKRSVGAVWQQFCDEWFVGKAPKTISYYKTAGPRLTHSAALTAQQLEDDMRRIQRDEKLTLASRAIYIRALRTFATWCLERGYVSYVRKVKVKVPHKPIATYSTEEMARIIEAARAKDGEFALLIELLAATGMRIHEALELQWSQILDDRIVLQAKDGINIEPVATTSRIDDIINRLPHNGPKVFRWGRSTQSRLHRTLVEVLAAAGVEHRGGFHVFRKTRWTAVIASGQTGEIASRLMRSTIGTAMKHYVAINISQLRAAGEAADVFPVSSPSPRRTTKKAKKTLK